MNFKAKRHEL